MLAKSNFGLFYTRALNTSVFVMTAAARPMTVRAVQDLNPMKVYNLSLNCLACVQIKD